MTESRAQTLEKSLMNAAEDLNKINALIHCTVLWEHYDAAIDMAKKMRPSHQTMYNMTTALAAVILFKNLHRSGVVTNCTLQEYRDAVITEGSR